jgi:hypothetical protein
MRQAGGRAGSECPHAMMERSAFARVARAKKRRRSRHSMDHLAIYDAPAAVKRYGYESVSSEMREYVQLPGYGHVDMLIGRGVETDVFPLVADWIKEVEAHS